MNQSQAISSVAARLRDSDVCANAVFKQIILSDNVDMLARLDGFAAKLEEKLATTKDEIVISIPAPCSDALLTVVRVYLKGLNLACYGGKGSNFEYVDEKFRVFCQYTPVTLRIDVGGTAVLSENTHLESLCRFFAVRNAPEIFSEGTRDATVTASIKNIAATLISGAGWPLKYEFTSVQEYLSGYSTTKRLREIGYLAEYNDEYITVNFQSDQEGSSLCSLALDKVKAMRKERKEWAEEQAAQRARVEEAGEPAGE